MNAELTTVTPLNLSVRPLTLAEHRLVIDYFHTADDALLETMGVDRAKLIPHDKWFEMMAAEYRKPLARRGLLYLGWAANGELVGHSNINHVRVGKEANIHLHLWREQHRGRGWGRRFFLESVNYFLAECALDRLICEPHSRNPAPNRLLQSLGLHPVAVRRTTPGAINFEQFVKRYEITRDLARELNRALRGLEA